MTDETTAPEGHIVTVKIKGGFEFEIDTGKIENEGVYQDIFVAGLTAILEKQGGMSKLLTGITKVTGAELGKRQAEVKAKAQETIGQMYDGTLRKGRAKAKVSGAVQTEAMRLAKAIVKQTLRDNGYKVGAFSAKEITAYAKDVLESNKTLYKTAEENLAQRAILPVKGLDVGAMLGERAKDQSLRAKPKVPPKPKAKGEGKATPAQVVAGAKVPPAKPKPAGATAH